LTPREVSEALSIKEFTHLCAALDVARPVTTVGLMHGDGSKFQQVAGGKLVRKFDVLAVEREEGKLYVTCDAGEVLRIEVAA
jgi:hypothetical protein